MSASEISPEDFEDLENDASRKAISAAQGLVEAHCASSDVRPGQVVRVVMITESIVDGETRRMDVFAKGPDGSGLYHWESMGFLEHAKEVMRRQA